MLRCALLLLLAGLPLAGASASEATDPACGPAHVDEVERVDHFLFLPDEESARAAAEQLGESRYRQQVHEAATEPGWVLYLENRVLPEPATFAADQARLRALAAEHGGRYGWHSCLIERTGRFARAD